MKKFACIFVALAALSLSPVPSFAQRIGVEVGPGGVRVGERGYHRDRGYHRGWDRGRHRGWDRPRHRGYRERVIIHRRHEY